MADVQDAILFPCCDFGGQNPSIVFNQRQLVEAIFAGIYACTSVWEAAASRRRDTPLKWAQFFGKNGKGFLAESSSSLFFFFSSVDHMPESREASESLVGLSHIRAPHFPPCVYKRFVFDSQLSCLTLHPKTTVRLGYEAGGLTSECWELKTC